MATGTIRAHGLREFQRAVARADRRSKKEIRAEFKEVGEIVRREWTERFSSVDQRSARGYRTRVRQRGVEVEQSLRKVTGKHPEYAAKQMRVGVDVLDDKREEAERQFEEVLDNIAEHFI